MIEHWSLKEYVLAFAASIVLTLTAYFISGAAVIGLGLLQALIQLVVFFHLGREERPRWNLITFLFMGIVLLVIVLGSLWIMYNLDYRMMSM